MLTLCDLQQFQSYKIREDRKTMADNLNRLVRKVVIEKEKNGIFRRDNKTRKVGYNILREKLYEQICTEFHLDKDQYKQCAKKYIKHQKIKVNMTFANLMSLNLEMYDYAMKILGGMLDEQRTTAKER